MKPSEIGKAYDQITKRWEQGRFNMENGIAAHNKALKFVKHRGRALDIGCGRTGRFIQLLINAGFTPSGVDVSQEMLQLARLEHPSVDFIHADICNYALPYQYDFVTAWDSLWHIPLSQQCNVMTKIIHSLNVGGIFVFSFGATEQASSHTNNTMGPEMYYSSLGTNALLTLCIELGCIIHHLEADQYPELHAYLIVEKIK